ncbi:MAG: glycosyltransferase family 39 protein [bacterium]|nr:glycosyltransferase family 39 protein [bacterium]
MVRGATDKRNRRPNRYRLADAAALLVAAGLLIMVRGHAFDLPLETDECNYAYIATRLVAGDSLYVDVWDHQPPGIFVLFAAVVGVCGNDPLVFRWLAVAVSLVTMVLMFAVARRAGGRPAAYLAVGLFALCSSDPGMAGEGCNRELFMNPFALAAVWLLLRREMPSRRDVMVAGLMLGLASTIKTIVAAQWAVLALWLLVRAWRSAEPQKRLRAAAAALLTFGLGPLAVWLAAVGHYVANGRVAEFWEATFLFNLEYAATEGGYWVRFVDFFRAPIHRFVFLSTIPLWIGAGIAAVVLPFMAPGRRYAAGTALVGYLFGSYLAVCLPGQLWPHYYYLMLPPLILVLAVALGQAMRLRWPSQWARPIRGVAGGLGGAVVVGLVALQCRFYLLVPTLRITDPRYDSRDLWGRAQGENVARVTDPDDTVLVYAQDVGVYYYSGRRCATRFTMVRPLEERYPGFAKRRAILLDEIRENRPRVLLMVDEPFPALHEYILANYQPVPRGIDFHDRRTNEPIMYLLVDKHRPIEDIDWNWHRSSVLE